MKDGAKQMDHDCTEWNCKQWIFVSSASLYMLMKFELQNVIHSYNLCAI